MPEGMKLASQFLRAWLKTLSLMRLHRTAASFGTSLEPKYTPNRQSQYEAFYPAQPTCRLPRFAIPADVSQVPSSMSGYSSDTHPS